MKSFTLLITMTAALALQAEATSPSTTPAMAEQHLFESQITRSVTLAYWVHLPRGYATDTSQSWPLVLFLHGAGERGDNLDRVLVHGPPRLARDGRDFPFILVSPQCPAGHRWDPEALLGLLDEVQTRYRVDGQRVYLTGLSMGGFGTWALASRYPERFAAIAPICGGGQTIDVLLAPLERQQALRGLGVWAFHGARDKVVPLEESERMVAAFRRVGVPDVKLTVYPEAEHDSWTETYNNPELYEWLLRHQRKAPTSSGPAFR